MTMPPTPINQKQKHEEDAAAEADENEKKKEEAMRVSLSLSQSCIPAFSKKQVSGDTSPRKRINRGGNFCGHNPRSPILSLAIPSANRPTFLYKVGDAFRKYYDDPTLFPTLNFAASSKRQQRSERREAVIQTMLAILEFLDIASLRIGIPTPKGFQPLKLAVLQRRTALHPRRFERAIESLRAAGIIDVSKQYKMQTVSGAFVYFPAIRRINPEFFAVLGLSDELKRERLEATKRLQKKAAKERATVTQMMQYSLSQAAASYAAWRKNRRLASSSQEQKEQPQFPPKLVLYNQSLNFYLESGLDPREAHKRAWTYANARFPTST